MVQIRKKSNTDVSRKPFVFEMNDQVYFKV